VFVAPEVAASPVVFDEPCAAAARIGAADEKSKDFWSVVTLLSPHQEMGFRRRRIRMVLETRPFTGMIENAEETSQSLSSPDFNRLRAF
jgi:hypothetical protein